MPPQTGNAWKFKFLYFPVFYPNYALFTQAGWSLERSSHPASCLRAGLKEASGFLFYNNLSVHLSQCGEDTDQTRVGSTHTAEDPFFQLPIVGGQNKKISGLGETQPRIFTQRDHFK